MKSTIGNKVVKFYEEYLAVSKKEEKADKKSRSLSVITNYDDTTSKEGYKKLTPEKRRLLAEQCPILSKGIKKKKMDTLRAWFNVETEKGRGKVINSDIQALRNFENRSNYKAKLFEAGKCSDIYGDGFLLINFLNDENKDLKDPVDKNSEPYTIKVLNPEFITDVKYINKYYKDKGIMHYIYDDGSRPEKYIHPDRIQHIVTDKLPYSPFGLSKIDLLRHTIVSKKNIDIATGRILSWFSHGILDFKHEGMTPEEEKEINKIAAKHPSAWIHDEEVEIKILQPTAIDPKPFHEYVVLNIAAALNMPTHILTGIQTGRVTGSEIGFGDYYRDVHDDQDLIFKPLIENLYRRILEARNKEWKYQIIWNPIYIDETTEAKLLKSRMEAANIGLTGGFITKKEARMIVNKGLIELDVEKLGDEIVKPPKPSPLPSRPISPQPPPSPSIKEKKVKTSLSEESKNTAIGMDSLYETTTGSYSNPIGKNANKEKKVKVSLSKEEEMMIKRCKKGMEKTILAEKKLGKKILKDQEKNENRDKNDRT